MNNRFFGKSETTTSNPIDAKLFRAIVNNDTMTAIKLLKEGANAGTYHSKKPIYYSKEKAALQWAFDNHNLILFKVLLCYGYKYFDQDNKDPKKLPFFDASSKHFDNKERFADLLQQELLLYESKSKSKPMLEEKSTGKKIIWIELQDLNIKTNHKSIK